MLTVKPGSKRPGLARDGDVWVLRVRERAIEGAANDACVKAVARALGLGPSQVELIRGHRGRIKTFATDALDERQIAERLDTHLDPMKGTGS